MALFKPMVGADKTALDEKTKVAGYAWFTTNDGKFYIDWDNNGTLMRSVLNAGHADTAGSASSVAWSGVTGKPELVTGYSKGSQYVPIYTNASGQAVACSSPSLLVNLASTSADTIFKSGPRPGVTGILNVVNGGTGSSTAPNAWGIIYAASSSAYASTAAGTTGQYLKSNGSAAPAWASFVTPTVTWDDGTTAGPTLKIKGQAGSSSAAVAIPSATSTTSGIVTIGEQTFAGEKTFNDGIVGNLTGNVTGNATSASKFSSNATVAVTGDATGTSAGSTKGWSVPLTLANSGVTEGTYGTSATASLTNGGSFKAPSITVDAKGRVTAASTFTLTLPTISASGLGAVTAVNATGTAPLTLGATKSGTTVSITGSVATAGANSVGVVKGWHRTSGKATGTQVTNASNAPAIANRSTTAGRYYGVETDNTGAMFVNVPWTDTNTHAVSSVNGYTGAVTLTYSDVGAAAASHGTHVTSDTVKSALGVGSGTSKYLREDGTWVTPPNTDTKVTQSRSSASNYRPLLMHHSNGDYGTDVGSATNSVYYNETIAAKPSTGELKATSFVGSGASLTSLNATHISSGTIAADRLPTSGVTAGTYGPSAAVTGNNNATMNVPEITVDSYGRVTKITNRVYTAKNSTYTSLKNPNALTVYGGSTKSFDYDGSAAKTLTIKAGSNITVTSDTSGNITIANSYSLPTATSSTKGGVIVGSNITVSSGTISLTKANVTAALGYTPPTSNTDTKVTQTLTTSNTLYPLLLAPNGQTDTTTTTSYFDSGVTLNPSNNTINANLNGNAATATKLKNACMISIGNVGSTFDGSSDISFSLSDIGAAAASHGTHVSYGTSASALGTSSAGSASTVSRSDHVHALPALTSCTGTLTIAKGGTGATDKSGARTNLGITSGPSLPSSGSPGDVFFLL